MLTLALRSFEFLFYHLLLSLVDWVSRLPRDSTVPEAMRLYRENIALKAQLDALERRLFLLEGRPKQVPVRDRAAQVFAYLLTRGNLPFQRYSLCAPLSTIQHWATRFRRFGRRLAVGGRPALNATIIDLIVTLKRENPGWGQRRISQELRRLGIRVSEPTIVAVLRDHGFSPHPGRGISFDRVRTTAKDALWALDYFGVQTAKGVWLQALLVIDIHTRELIDLKVHDGWDVDSAWTARAFGESLNRSGRTPQGVVHDHGTHFRGQFERQLRVLGIDDQLTPVRIPQLNCYAERAIGSVRRELLRHVRVRDAADLQFLLDEYRRYANTERAHQGLAGRTPAEVSEGIPEAEVLDLAALRTRRLVRREYAHGLLSGYTLAPGDPESRQAA